MTQKLVTEPAEKTQQSTESREVSQESAPTFQSECHSLNHLHRVLGNHGVTKLLQTKRLTPEGKITGLQRKLTVGAADDQYEQEADRVARQVMATPEAAAAANAMQRAISPEEDKDKMLQTKPLAASITPYVQREMLNNEEPEDKDKPVQAKSGGSMSGSFDAGTDVETQVSQSKGRGSPLPDPVRSYMEPRFGVDFSNVRVHTGSDSIQMNRNVGAQAFTHGSDIYFGEGHSPSNLELTAHELTHVVQQTGGAPLQLKKEDKASTAGTEGKYEQLAAIGESPITLSQQAEYRSPALQMRSEIRRTSFQSSLNLIVQRTVSTSGGEWDTDKYDSAIDKDMNGNPTPSAWGMRGVDIKIKFKPNDKIDAELIGLTQTANTTQGGSAKFLTKTVENRSIKSADAVNVGGVSDEGAHVDRVSTHNNPIYAVSAANSASLADSATSAGWGQHGWHYKDKTGALKNQDAILIDAPRYSNSEKDSSQIFETTALATKGIQNGTYFGSVRWGWRTDAKGNFNKVPFSKVSDGVPSSTFMKSAELWNASKTSTGADTIDLPIVDVKVTSAPITGVYPPGFIGPPLQIPSGTRIQILRNAVAPNTNGQIKVVDGVFTGNMLEVAPADMANIRDERP